MVEDSSAIVLWKQHRFPDLVPKEQFCEAILNSSPALLPCGKITRKVVLVFENQQVQ